MKTSLLKFATHTRNETWYACVLHHFHDDNRHFSPLLIFIGGLPPFTEIYVVVYKKEWRQVNKNPANFKKEGMMNKKGDKIWTEYRNSFNTCIITL